MFMQNFFRLNEGEIVEIIIAFINKNIGNKTITEVDYDKLGIQYRGGGWRTVSCWPE